MTRPLGTRAGESPRITSQLRRESYDWLAAQALARGCTVATLARELVLRWLDGGAPLVALPDGESRPFNFRIDSEASRRLRARCKAHHSPSPSRAIAMAIEMGRQG